MLPKEAEDQLIWQINGNYFIGLSALPLWILIAINVLLFAWPRSLPARAWGWVIASGPLLTTTPLPHLTPHLLQTFKKWASSDRDEKIKAEKTNPRGSDLVFQQSLLLNWLLGQLGLESPRGHIVPPQTPGKSHHESLYPFPWSYWGWRNGQMGSEADLNFPTTASQVARMGQIRYKWQKFRQRVDFLGSYPYSSQQPDVLKEHKPWNQTQGLTAGSMHWLSEMVKREQTLGKETQLLYNYVILSELYTFSESQCLHQKAMFLEQNSI